MTCQFSDRALVWILLYVCALYLPTPTPHCIAWALTFPSVWVLPDHTFTFMLPSPAAGGLPSLVGERPLFFLTLRATDGRTIALSPSLCDAFRGRRIDWAPG